MQVQISLKLRFHTFYKQIFSRDNTDFILVYYRYFINKI